MNGLQRIIYQSTGTGSTESLLNMATILAESQRNNARDGLTGALAAHDGRFIQVLEGRQSDLDRLLTRLDRDPRHRDVVIIDRTPIESRTFEGWSMANARIDPALAPRLDDLMNRDAPPAEKIVAMIRDAIQPN